MLKYTLKRLLLMIPVLLGVSFVVFLLMYISPGDPAKMILGEMAEPEEIEALRETLGLNAGFWERYLNYMRDIILYGDLGISYTTREPVIVEVMERFPITLRLASSGVLVALCIGIPCGIIAATKQYSIFDKIGTFISLFGASAPSFWIAMVLVLFFSVKLKWLPPTGTYGPIYWILPVATLGFQASASIMRMTRSSMLEVIRQDYIRTSHAKGQTEFKTIMVHGFRNALVPIITVVGIRICGFLAGAVLVETVFAIPGLGKFIIDSVNFKDYPVVQGGVLWIGLNCIIINLLTDIVYCFVDPRIKAVYAGKKRGTKEINNATMETKEVKANGSTNDKG